MARAQGNSKRVAAAKSQSTWPPPAAGRGSVEAARHRNSAAGLTNFAPYGRMMRAVAARSTRATPAAGSARRRSPRIADT